MGQEHWWQRSKGLFIDVSHPGGLHLASETWPHPTASRLQSCMPRAKHPVEWGHSPTHQQLFSSTLSCVQLFATPWTIAHQASLSFTISQSLLKLMSIASLMPFNHLVLCCPLLLLPSQITSIWVFSNELALHIRWPKYWIFSISASNEYSGLISFRMDRLDILTVQGTLKTLLQPQFKSISSSVFFMVQLTSIHDYWKNHSFDMTLHKFC